MASTRAVLPTRRLTEHRTKDLVTIFNELFYHSFNTRLEAAPSVDPLYLPLSKNCPYHRLQYANGFFASALHEISHWCIAGKERHFLKDFGYWYKPEGRTAEEQSRFLKAETKPQAIEWLFSAAAGKEFHISLDDFSGKNADGFEKDVKKQALSYLDQGPPPRAATFLTSLWQCYEQEAKFRSYWMRIAGIHLNLIKP